MWNIKHKCSTSLLAEEVIMAKTTIRAPQNRPVNHGLESKPVELHLGVEQWICMRNATCYSALRLRKTTAKNELTRHKMQKVDRIMYSCLVFCREECVSPTSEAEK